MIEKISYFLGSRDEAANIALAVQLSETENIEGIREIVNGLREKSQISNDCIKVLYEIGERNPNLIADYVSEFLGLLDSKNNRMVWGAMMALSRIAYLTYNEIFSNLNMVLNAYKVGSVITIDNSISVFAELVKANVDSQNQVYNILINHLSTCRPKEVGQHAERAYICINEFNSEEFKQVIQQRMDSLTEPQKKRVNKLIHMIEEKKFDIRE